MARWEGVSLSRCVLCFSSGPPGCGLASESARKVQAGDAPDDQAGDLRAPAFAAGPSAARPRVVRALLQLKSWVAPHAAITRVALCCVVS